MNHPNLPSTPLQPTASGTLPGFKGGFAQSDPAFAYPTPDLSSLPLTGNHQFVDLIQRQMGVRWPEFSWAREYTVTNGLPDPDESTRCFQMFAPYISRIGYNDEGQSFAIICPQQGVWLGDEVCLNVEVTVTGQRGWVDETADNRTADEGTIAADLMVLPHIWLTLNPSASAKWKNIWHELDHWGGFPTTKANAIKLRTSSAAVRGQTWFALRKGMSDRFTSPDFTQHYSDDAFTVANLEVAIGEPMPAKHLWVREFNTLLMKAFNVAAGNMLAPGNVLTWNVWFAAPNYVCTKEWNAHAARWRLSIDAHHGSPDGPSSIVRDANGNKVTAADNLAEDALHDLTRLVSKIHGYL